MKIPESMKEELGAWNDGKGIDLDSWISCAGNFSLAVGYASIFCPKFVEFEDYIFQAESICDQTIKNIRGFEAGEESTPKSVEWVINHLHIADLQYDGCEDSSVDKIVVVGKSLKEIYEAKLNYLFPSRPCVVEFYQPGDPGDLQDYQLSFWQKKNDQSLA